MTLSEREIDLIPAGRIMDTFVREYVYDTFPMRWSNGEQKDILCHWFEELPRSCAEDDGGSCISDWLFKYSTDLTDAMRIPEAPIFKEKTLTTHSEPSQSLFPAMEKRFWATFSTVKFGDTNYRWKQVWANAETMPLAICRAALLSLH